MRQLTLHQPIGSGAFGTVYAAELSGERGMRRKVAVKVISGDHGEQRDDFVKRVRDEARLLGLLQDESILAVLDLLQLEGRDCVVMEWVDGVDLSRIIAAGWRMPPRALASFGATVAGALGKAHTARHPDTGCSLGVIHRDVKPANIMLTGRGHIKLLDFGVARAAFDAREARTGRMVLGTLLYMAPEYILRGELSTAVDIYGLGLTLGEAAIGREFGKPSLERAKMEGRLRAWLAELPGDYGPMRVALEQMLAWEPGQRPDGAHCEQMLLELADASAGTGLQRWCSKVVPTVDSGEPEDGEGLAGRRFDLDSGSHTAPEAEMTVGLPPPAPAPTAEPTGFERQGSKPDSTLAMVMKGLALGGCLGLVGLSVLVAILWYFR
ncbi:MAG TPA: serine/threonine-protein kinase [Myxococcota bacterium]|nr:serine/threonine-protein kinase [Myxococcota bacterium]